MKKPIYFTKMHGLGNDFIVVDAINQRLDENTFEDLAKAVCDRHFGIGGDGLVLVLASDHSEFKMRIFNSDGSEPQMCGNGMRCFAKFVYESKLTDKEIFSVETLAGVMIPALLIKEGVVHAIEVDMGPAVLERAKIPMSQTGPSPVIQESMTVAGVTYGVTAVSMGNPHAVIFVEDIEAVELEKIGPLCEHHPLFPERTNTEFVQVLNRNEAIMRVWERGAGETLACGTGACAVTVAGVLNNSLDRKALIHLPGGDLSIEWQMEGHVMMTGPATTVFTGEIEIEGDFHEKNA